MKIGWKLLEQWAKNMQREIDRFKVTFIIGYAYGFAARSRLVHTIGLHSHSYLFPLLDVLYIV